MHIWTISNWEHYLDNSGNRRTGLRFKYESSVDDEVKEACKHFANWLRSEYYFPLRVPVYIKGEIHIKTMDGDKAVGTFFEPFDYSVEPYIRIATGDYKELKRVMGKDDAIASIFLSIAHELTHYYQWINNLPLTDIGRERQATRYSHFIVDEYSMAQKNL